MKALLVLLLTALAAGSALAAPSPASSSSHGKGKGANVAPVCAATKNAWSSTSACTRFQAGICETAATCPLL